MLTYHASPDVVLEIATNTLARWPVDVVRIVCLYAERQFLSVHSGLVQPVDLWALGPHRLCVTRLDEGATGDEAWFTDFISLPTGGKEPQRDGHVEWASATSEVIVTSVDVAGREQLSIGSWEEPSSSRVFYVPDGYRWEFDLPRRVVYSGGESNDGATQVSQWRLPELGRSELIPSWRWQQPDARQGVTTVVRCSPDGKLVYVADVIGELVYVLDATCGTVSHIWSVSGLSALAVDPASGQLCVGRWRGTKAAAADRGSFVVDVLPPWDAGGPGAFLPITSYSLFVPGVSESDSAEFSIACGPTGQIYACHVYSQDLWAL